MSDSPTSIDYERLIESARAGKPLTATDVAKAVLWRAIDPYGLYRAAGGAVLSYLDASKLTGDDSQNLREILKAGQEAGCDELEIEIDKERFVGLKGNLVEPESGMNVGVEAGASGKGKYKIRVKYK